MYLLYIYNICTSFSIRLLADDAHLNLRANPIDSQDPQGLYKRCQDGILLWYVKLK
jgi:hypothetical protein